MKRVVSRSIKCAIFLLLLNLPLAVAWEVIFPGRIYDCTDHTSFGYVMPGHWVHGPIEYVDEVVTGRDMGEPDTILRGWSVSGLWGVWSALFSLSAAGSWWLSGDSWKKRAVSVRRSRAMGVG